MEQLRNLGDERQLEFCVHCGGATETRDHVPSRIFLDKPYPENLPVVPACEPCNKGFSNDEEYLACLIECARFGSDHPEIIQRDKIKYILRHKPALASRLAQSKIQATHGTTFNLELKRVRRVMLKLARGHVVFDLNEQHHEEPSIVRIEPLRYMPDDDLRRFESPQRFTGTWPEVGSRAMQRLILDGSTGWNWTVVQPQRYRYLVTVDQKVIVRIVVGEYLGAEVIW